MQQTGEWERVTKSAPCPVCDHPDWCSVGAKVIHCMRMKSDRPVESGGWLHKRDGTTELLPMSTKRKPHLTDLVLHNRFAPLARHWWKDAGDKTRELAEALGVAWYALDDIKCGWNGSEWTLPERNHAELFVGINRRFADGSKVCMVGSRRGLICSDAWTEYPGPVLIVEGASDTSAGITMGLSTIGRPNNTGGGAYLVSLLRATDATIVVMGENDRKDDGRWPGKEGAVAVAGKLRKHLLGRKILVRMPLDGAKDLRGWLNARGVDPENIEACWRLGKSLVRRLTR